MDAKLIETLAIAIEKRREIRAAGPLHKIDLERRFTDVDRAACRLADTLQGAYYRKLPWWRRIFTPKTL